ncbi:MAG: NifB/NifX family molybdenum-iron cluster-binding protein [Geothrix sp.]|nr:NifB/NifX family molybdenum-iron cluster-binding protein [Geothrix sp.]
MRIAFPTTDGARISAHFGRCQSFLILDVDAGTVKSRDIRANDQEPGTGHGHDHGHAHDHNAFVRLLGDCEAVMCGGIGPGARHALESAGLKVHLVPLQSSPEEAAIALATGTFTARTGPSCGPGTA